MVIERPHLFAWRRTLEASVALFLMTGIAPAPAGAPGESSCCRAARWSVQSYNPPHLGVAYGNGLYVAVGEGRSIYTSGDGVRWTRRPSGIRNSLFGVAYGSGNFVAVGARGAILSSPDGATWALRDSGGTRHYYAVTHANGLFVAVGFVAVGQDGTVVTSPDAVNWSAPTTVGESLLGVTFGNGAYGLSTSVC